MKRGEIWWANLPPPANRRPVLLLSRDRAYKVRTQVTVAMTTSTVRGIPSEVQLVLADGVPQSCVVNLDDIQTISKASIDAHITTLHAARMEEVRQAIFYALALT